MSQQKYDWFLIKKAYMASDILQPRVFIKNHRLDSNLPAIPNGTLNDNITGWAKEKRAYLQAKIKKGNLKVISSPEVQSRVEKLKSHLETVEDSIGYIVTKNRKKVLINGVERIVLDLELSDMRDLKIAHEILRLATGQSTINLETQTQISINGNPLNFE